MTIDVEMTRDKRPAAAPPEINKTGGGSHGSKETSPSDQCNRFAQLLQYAPGSGSHLLADKDYQIVGSMEEAIDKGIDLWADVYVTVRRFRGRSRTKKNAVDGSYVAIDIDHGSPEALKDEILKSKVPPAILVGTAKGIHAWWRLESPESPEQLELLTAHLVKVFGADGHAKDSARLLRLPGSMHTGAGVIVRLLHADEGAVTDVEALLALTLEDGAPVRNLLARPSRAEPVSRQRIARGTVNQRAKGVYLPVVSPHRELPASHELQRLSREFPQGTGKRDDLIWKIYWEACQCGWSEGKILEHLQALVGMIPDVKKRTEWYKKLPSECGALAQKCKSGFGLVRSTFKRGMLPKEFGGAPCGRAAVGLPLADAEKALEEVLVKRLGAPSPTRNMIVQATFGLGKSSKALEIIKSLATQKMKFVFLTDTREQAAEQARVIGVTHYQAPVGDPASIYYCAQYDKLQQVIERKGSIRGHCKECGHRAICGAFRLRNDLPKEDILVSTKASARHSPELLKGRHVICDERLEELLFEDYSITAGQLQRFIVDGTTYIEANPGDPAASDWRAVVRLATVLWKSIAKMAAPRTTRRPGLISLQLRSRIRRGLPSQNSVKLDATRGDLGLRGLFTGGSRTALPWEVHPQGDQPAILGRLILQVIRAAVQDGGFPHRVVKGRLEGRVVADAAAEAFKAGRVTILDALGLPQFLVEALGMEVETVSALVENTAVIAAPDRAYPKEPATVIEVMQRLYNDHGSDFFAMVSKGIELSGHGIPGDCIGHYGADDRARNNLAGRHHVLVLRHQQNLDAAWIGFEAWRRFAPDHGLGKISKSAPTSHRSTRRIHYPGQRVSVELPQSQVAAFQDYLEHLHDGFILQAIHRARPVRSPGDLFVVYLLDWEPVRALRYSRFITKDWLLGSS